MFTVSIDGSGMGSLVCVCCVNRWVRYGFTSLCLLRQYMGQVWAHYFVFTVSIDGPGMGSLVCVYCVNRWVSYGFTSLCLLC